MLTCSVAVWLLTTTPKNPEELQRDLPSAVDETGQVAQAVTQIVTTVDLVGVFFFAISGAILAVRKGYDIVGSLLLALFTGLIALALVLPVVVLVALRLPRLRTAVEILTLLRKPDAAKVEVETRWVGFDIPNEFVVGYGLDYAEGYRNLREVATLAPHVYS